MFCRTCVKLNKTFYNSSYNKKILYGFFTIQDRFLRYPIIFIVLIEIMTNQITANSNVMKQAQFAIRFSNDSIMNIYKILKNSIIYDVMKLIIVRSFRDSNHQLLIRIIGRSIDNISIFDRVVMPSKFFLHPSLFLLLCFCAFILFTSFSISISK